MPSVKKSVKFVMYNTEMEPVLISGFGYHLLNLVTLALKEKSCLCCCKVFTVHLSTLAQRFVTR